MKSLFRTLSLGIVSLLLASCSGTDKQPTDENPSLRISGDTVTLTGAQRARLGLTTETIVVEEVGTDLTVNGIIDVPPQSMAKLSAPLGGIVRSIAVLQGARVRKGQILATLDDPRFIELQRDYLLANTRLEVLQKELQRQQTLANEQINAGKVTEKIAGEVRELFIQRKSLEEHLALLHVNANRLTVDNISKSITLTSPIDGYVTGVYAVNGEYVSPNDSLINIKQLDDLHAELFVYERDIQDIGEGWPFTATINNAKGTTISGRIHLIEKGVGPGRTVTVHGILDPDTHFLLPGTSLTARIYGTRRKGLVAPTSSLITDAVGTWLFIQKDHNTFVRHKVGLGVSRGGKTELMVDSTWFVGNQVVVRGASMLSGAFSREE
jgi:membrane fusion protein, heavy metal efflux system